MHAVLNPDIPNVPYQGQTVLVKVMMEARIYIITYTYT